MNAHYKVLIIDDDPATLNICRLILSEQGLETQGVGTGQAALQALSSATYDLLLLDIGLPDIDGLNVLEHVTTHYAQVSPIMMTGYATLEATVRAQELGAEGFILKPFDGEKLAQIVQRVIARRRLREDYAQLQALVQHEKLAALGRLAASLAHEINNPLQALRSGLRLLGRPQLEETKRQKYLAMLAQEVERLIALISQTLDFVRPSEVGQQPTALNQLLQDTLTLVNKQLQQNKIETNFSQDPNLPLIPLIPGQIKQVFLNLILNAIDAMPQGGVLSLATVHLPTEQKLKITVQDSGCGMAPEVVGRIFEPFYSTKQNGIGLGLSISYSIIERHGGQIEVASKPERGSRFTLYLTYGGETPHENGPF